MAANSITIEDFDAFKQGLVSDLASQLNADGGLVTKLVESLSKKIADKIIVSKPSALPQKTETAPQKDAKQKEQQTNRESSLLSKSAEQALLKIPMLASVLVEIAKNTKIKETKLPSFADVFTFENFYKKAPKLATELKTFTFKDMYAALPKGFERYFQSIKDVLNNGFKSSKTKKGAEEETADATKPSKTFLEKEASSDQKVLLDGFTQPGLEQLTNLLPEIIKKGMGTFTNGLITALGNRDSAKKDDSTQQSFGKGLLKDLKGLAGLAGLGALLFALQTDGPFKGIAKLASRGLLQVSGWTKLIDGFVGKFLKKLIKIPFKLIRNFEKSFAGLIEKEAFTGSRLLVRTGLGKLTGFATKFLAGAMKVLKKVPFVGSLISVGMAFSRFKQGDVVGGGLEVLSGLAGLLNIVAPGVGTALSLSIDGLNAFLDYKAGGTPEGGGKGKGGILLGWIHDLSNFIYKNFIKKIRSFPVIGPLFKAIDAFKAGDWKRGLKQLTYTNPIFEIIGELLGDQDTTGSAKKIAGAAFKIGDMFKSLTSALMKKVKDWWKSISSGFRMLFEAVIPDDAKKELNGVEPSQNEQANPSAQPNQTTTEQTQQTASANPALTTTTLSEAVTPNQPTAKTEQEEEQPEQTSITPEPTEQPVQQTFSDKSAEHLSTLVKNSDTANQTMANLVVGFNTLAKALERLGISVAENGGNTTVINNGNNNAGPVRASTAADYARSGNSTISSFRNFIEQSRQTPA